MRIWLMQTGEPYPLDDSQFDDSQGSTSPARFGSPMLGGLPMQKSSLMRTGRLARELCKRGHAVTWWGGNFSHRDKSIIAPHNSVLRINGGTKLILLGGGSYSRNLSLSRYYHGRRVAEQFRRLSVNEPRPDIILAALPSHDLAYQAVAYGRTLGVPVVVDIRDLWPDAFLAFIPAALRRLARILLRPDFRKASEAAKHAHCLTAISERYLEWGLAKAGRSRSGIDSVFYIGALHPSSTRSPMAEQAAAAALDDFTAKAADYCKNPVAVYVGSFGHTFDLQTLLDAARILLSQAPKLRVVLIGAGEQFEKAQAAAGTLTNVWCTGWLSPHEIDQVLSRSRCGLALYTSRAPQSLPNKPFQYFAAGLPVVSSLTGELEQLVAEYRVGLPYRAGDAAQLADAIMRVLSDEHTSREMGRRARSLFEERFSAARIDHDYANFLERIVETAFRTERYGT